MRVRCPRCVSERSLVAIASPIDVPAAPVGGPAAVNSHAAPVVPVYVVAFTHGSLCGLDLPLGELLRLLLFLGPLGMTDHCRVRDFCVVICQRKQRHDRPVYRALATAAMGMRWQVLYRLDASISIYVQNACLSQWQSPSCFRRRPVQSRHVRRRRRTESLRISERYQ